VELTRGRKGGAQRKASKRGNLNTYWGGGGRQQQETHPLEGVCVYFINLKSTPKQWVPGPSATFNMKPPNINECQLSHTMFMLQ